MFSSIPKLMAGGAGKKTPNAWHTGGMVPSALCLTSSANLLSHQHPPISVISLISVGVIDV